MAASAEVEVTVRSVLQEVFPDVDVPQIDRDANLVEALEIDSMDLVDLVLELERETGIRIENEDFEKLTSIGAVVAYISDRADHA